MQGVSILKEDFEESLLNIAGAIDDFEGYTHPHAVRIAVLSNATAKLFNLASHDRHL